MVEPFADGTTVATDPTVMLLASLTFRVQSFKRAEALSSVDALVQRMRGTSGCLRSRVLDRH